MTDVPADPKHLSDPGVSPGCVVLFVDDEAVIRDLARAALTRAGYMALVVDRGEEALRLVQSGGNRIDVAIIDWNMPGMRGAELLTALRALRPALPIVISSGSDDAETRNAQAQDRATFLLQKPWRMRALLDLVASVKIVTA